MEGDEVGIVPLLSIYSMLQSRPRLNDTTNTSAVCALLDSDQLVQGLFGMSPFDPGTTPPLVGEPTGLTAPVVAPPVPPVTP